jgi:hypothetical protein
MRDWLPKVVPGLKPWLSVREIPKGRRGALDIWEALAGINIGIICLTKENILEPWILFESGALSKSFSDSTTLVCTYLLDGLNHSDLPAPLRDFQYTRPEKEDTRKMVQDITEAINDGELSESEKAELNTAFDALWPEFAKQLNEMPPVESSKQPAAVADKGVAPVSPTPMSSAASVPEWQPWSQTIWVKRKGVEELEYVDGHSYIETPEPGVLLIYRGPNILAEFHDIEDWGVWGENNGAEVRAKYKVDPKLVTIGWERAHVS